ncbi:MAG TPA: hypothetical protein VF824_14525 [Thermoanaerobaculia bacterium]|jgi:hypothetical protein
MTRRRLLPLALLLAACASSTPRIPDAWLQVEQAPRITSLSIDAAGKVTTNPGRAVNLSAIQARGGRIYNGDKALTPRFEAIDSLDVSQARGEVVFSARRDKDFDIGLVSTDGSDVHWVPNDPADELQPRWAPRGNKISFIVRTKSGDVVRTVHVPTATALAVDFPYATIHALAWDPPAERYAVSYSTPDASDRVEVTKYGGEERRMAVPPAVRLSVDLQPFARDAMMLRPLDVAYGEKLPLVLWVGDFDWSDARAALLRNARAACVIARRAPDEALWKSIRETPWLDPSRVYLVGAADPGALRSIVGDAAVASGRYRVTGNVVSVPPAVVQSFAAGFIADQLKRNSPPNGSSR